ncbi:MAG: hypothetical protein M3Q71_22155 [Chloroflexota bacterium]|nr:hypothetical protein [Chloroflexota bacterium]
MSNHGKRLAALAAIYQRPAEPADVTPFDPSLLTDEETTELGEIYADMQTFDVGSVRLDRRADIRARLDTLTDEQLERLETLQRKGWGMTTWRR